MRFLADVEWLRAAGHDARHLREEGLHRLPNGEIFKKADAEERVLLTFDLDFAEIVALAGSRKPSVIVFRLNNTTTPHVIARLGKVLAESSDAIEHGAIISVEDARHRVRRLPLGS